MNAAVFPRLVRRAPWGSQFAAVAVVLLLVSATGWKFQIGYRAEGQIYLFAVILLSLTVSRWAALFAAVASGLVWNFVFIPPVMSFSVLHLEDSLLLGVYFLVALGGGHVAILQEAARRERVLAESERLHVVLFDSLTHELKTPLSVLRAAVEEAETEDRGKRDQMLRIVRVTVQRMEGLVANLLNHNRLESGVIQPRIAACEVRDLVRGAQKSLGDRIGDRVCEVAIPEDIPLVAADAPLAEQAIANVLLNAVVHTPPGTRVRIDAGSEEAAGRVFVRIHDDGLGIPTGMRANLFDKFQRGERRSGPGLGLGLSIVHGFVRIQGGDISVECPPGGGCTFTLSLRRFTSRLPLPNEP